MDEFGHKDTKNFRVRTVKTIEDYGIMAIKFRDLTEETAMRKKEFVIPAQPGIKTLFVDTTGIISIGIDVIGWYVRPYDWGGAKEVDDLPNTDATIGAVTISGIVGIGSPKNHFGYYHPNGTVSGDGFEYMSLADAQAGYDSPVEINE